MDDKKHLDFVTALVLICFGIYVLIESIRMTFDSGKTFLASPGLMPGFLGVMLIFCAIILLAQSLKGVGLSVMLHNVGAWWHDMVRSELARNTLIGIVLIGLYIFVLLHFFNYWLATLIMLIFLFLYLKATSVIKSILIAAVTVGCIVGVFVYGFHVPLP